MQRLTVRQIAYLLLLGTLFTLPWEELFRIPGIGTLSKVLGLMGGAVWGLTMIVEGQFRRLTSFHVISTVFLFWGACTVYWSIDADASLKALFGCVQLLVLAVMIWDLLPTKAGVRTAIQVYVLGSWAPVLSTFSNFAQGNSVGTGRFSATGSNANTTGVLLGISLPLAWYCLFWAGNSRKGKILAYVNLAYFACAFFAITLTATRFAVLMSIPTLMFTVLSLRRLPAFLRSVVTTCMVLGVLLLPAALPKDSIERLLSAEDELENGDFNGRGAIWEAGLTEWRAQPVLGIGNDAFPHAVATHFGRPRSAHNAYVAMLCELGLVGIGIVACLAWSVLATVLQQPREDRSFWFVTVMVLAMANMPMTYHYEKITWLVLGLLVASAHAVDRAAAPVAAAAPAVPTDPVEAGPVDEELPFPEIEPVDLDDAPAGLQLPEQG